MALEDCAYLLFGLPVLMIRSREKWFKWWCLWKSHHLKLSEEVQGFESETRRLRGDLLAVLQYLEDHHGEGIIDLFYDTQEGED